MIRSFKRSSLIILACLMGIALMVFLVFTQVKADSHAMGGCSVQEDAFCVAPRTSRLADQLESATIPKIATPVWMNQQDSSVQTVTYVVDTRGAVTSDLDEFARVASQTLNDSRGWTRLGIKFEQVAANGDFVLMLSEASQMTTFSATGCDTTYSCRVGKFVIFNEERWKQGSTPFLEAGGSLADYRRMVINHETGHWLGHGHTHCTKDGEVATVMQQQSIDMQGCTPGVWPLPSELYAPTLGIRS